jgi:hypothetical protein
MPASRDEALDLDLFAADPVRFVPVDFRCSRRAIVEPDPSDTFALAHSRKHDGREKLTLFGVSKAELAGVVFYGAREVAV